MQHYRGCKARGTADGTEASARRCSSAYYAGTPEEMTAAPAGLAEKGTAAGLTPLLPPAAATTLPSRLRKVRELWHWKLLLFWVLSCSVLSLGVLFFMSSQATERRNEALASMCDERAQMLQDQVNATMNHVQALAILVSTFHHSKNPSAMDQMTFARFAERTAFERPLTSGVAYATRVTHAERELFERQQAWSIKAMYSLRSKKRSPDVHGDANVRSPAEEYAPVIFAQEAYRHVVSFDLLSGKDDRDAVHRARESGKGVLTAPFKLLNDRIGVILMYTVYKSELPQNATPQLRIQSAIGYLGGIIDIEALVDKMLYKLGGTRSIMVKLYDTTNESPVTMYGSNSNDTGSDMRHISMLNFGDPSRKHEMHCRFKRSPPWPWLAIASSYGTLVTALLIGYIVHFTVKRIAEVEDGYKVMSVLNKRAEDADILTNEVLHEAKVESCKLEHEAVPSDLRTVCDDTLSLFCGEALIVEQDETVEQEELNLRLKVQEKRRETLRNMEELGMRSKFIHSLPSRFRYFYKTSVSIALLGLVLYIVALGTFDLPFYQNLGIRSGDDNNMMSSSFGRSRGRLLVATLHDTRSNAGVQNGDMISIDLRNTRVNGNSSGHRKQWSSHKTNEIIPLNAHRSHEIKLAPWIALVSLIILVLGIAVWLVLWCNRRKRVPQNELELLGVIGPRRFQLHELAAATSNFTDDNKLGQGGFGPVYKGYLSDQGCHVAIKVLSKKQQSSREESDQQGLREFMAEVRVMTQLRHRNVVKLIGWCNSNKQLLLVYELMAQGSLDKHLYDTERILTWQQRYRIALDLGSALLYLHRDCEKCIVHGDIKPANVMLDESHNAKLGDFGLARLVEHGEEPQTTTVIAGTPGYIDPEFINNGWPRTELDVYSFGVVLLEIACGKRPASRQPNGASSLLAWVRNLYDRGTILDAADQRLNGEFDQQQMVRVLVTGLWCAHQDPIQRPSIVQAMDVLRSAGAELPVLPAVIDARRIRSMEEQAYGELPVADRPVHGGAPSTYFTSKDSTYLLAEE